MAAQFIWIFTWLPLVQDEGHAPAGLDASIIKTFSLVRYRVLALAALAGANMSSDWKRPSEAACMQLNVKGQADVCSWVCLAARLCFKQGTATGAALGSCLW